MYILHIFVVVFMPSLPQGASHLRGRSWLLIKYVEKSSVLPRDIECFVCFDAASEEILIY